MSTKYQLNNNSNIDKNIQRHMEKQNQGQQSLFSKLPLMIFFDKSRCRPPLTKCLLFIYTLQSFSLIVTQKFIFLSADSQFSSISSFIESVRIFPGLMKSLDLNNSTTILQILSLAILFLNVTFIFGLLMHKQIKKLTQTGIQKIDTVIETFEQILWFWQKFYEWVFFIPLLEACMLSIRLAFKLGILSENFLNLFSFIIVPSINIALLLLNLFLNKFMLEMAAFRFRNRLMRRISRMDFIIMILLIFVITIHSLPDEFYSPLDVLYLIVTCAYSLCLFLDTILDSPFMYADTTRFYRTMSFILVTASCYTIVARIMDSFQLTSEIKHFINIITLIPFIIKLAEQFDNIKVANELHISDLIPDYSAQFVKKNAVQNLWSLNRRMLQIYRLARTSIANPQSRFSMIGTMSNHIKYCIQDQCLCQTDQFRQSTYFNIGHLRHLVISIVYQNYENISKNQINLPVKLQENLAMMWLYFTLFKLKKPFMSYNIIAQTAADLRSRGGEMKNSWNMVVFFVFYQKIIEMAYDYQRVDQNMVSISEDYLYNRRTIQKQFTLLMEDLIDFWHKQSEQSLKVNEIYIQTINILNDVKKAAISIKQEYNDSKCKKIFIPYYLWYLESIYMMFDQQNNDLMKKLLKEQEKEFQLDMNQDSIVDLQMLSKSWLFTCSIYNDEDRIIKLHPLNNSELVLGYNYVELTGRSIRDLMPKTMSDIHFAYLKKYKNRIFGYEASKREDGEVEFSKKYLRKFLKTSQGHIVLGRTLYSVDINQIDNFIIFALVQPLKSDSEFILFSRNGLIDSMSERIHKKSKLSKYTTSMLHNIPIYWFLPKLLRSLPEQFQEECTLLKSLGLHNETKIFIEHEEISTQFMIPRKLKKILEYFEQIKRVLDNKEIQKEIKSEQKEMLQLASNLSILSNIKYKNSEIYNVTIFTDKEDDKNVNYEQFVLEIKNFKRLDQDSQFESIMKRNSLIQQKLQNLLQNNLSKQIKLLEQFGIKPLNLQYKISKESINNSLSINEDIGVAQQAQQLDFKLMKSFYQEDDNILQLHEIEQNIKSKKILKFFSDNDVQNPTSLISSSQQYFYYLYDIKKKFRINKETTLKKDSQKESNFELSTVKNAKIEISKFQNKVNLLENAKLSQGESAKILPKELKNDFNIFDDLSLNKFQNSDILNQESNSDHQIRQMEEEEQNKKIQRIGAGQSSIGSTQTSGSTKKIITEKLTSTNPTIQYTQLSTSVGFYVLFVFCFFVANYYLVTQVLTQFVIELEAMRFPNSLFSPIAYDTAYTENQRLYFSQNQTISDLQQQQFNYAEQFLSNKLLKYSESRLEFVNEKRQSAFRDIILTEQIKIRQYSTESYEEMQTSMLQLLSIFEEAMLVNSEKSPLEYNSNNKYIKFMLNNFIPFRQQFDNVFNVIVQVLKKQTSLLQSTSLLLFCIGAITCSLITFINIFLYHKLLTRVEGLFKIYTSLSTNDLKQILEYNHGCKDILDKLAVKTEIFGMIGDSKKRKFQMKKVLKTKEGKKKRLRAREVLKLNRTPMIIVSFFILSAINAIIYSTYNEINSFVVKFSPSTEQLLEFVQGQSAYAVVITLYRLKIAALDDKKLVNQDNMNMDDQLIQSSLEAMRITTSIVNMINQQNLFPEYLKQKITQIKDRSLCTQVQSSQVSICENFDKGLLKGGLIRSIISSLESITKNLDMISENVKNNIPIRDYLLSLNDEDYIYMYMIVDSTIDELLQETTDNLKLVTQSQGDNMLLIMIFTLVGVLVCTFTFARIFLKNTKRIVFDIRQALLLIPMEILLADNKAKQILKNLE